jgi:hypothetical protein
MEHFICAGTCGGAASVAGVCNDPECSKTGEALSSCNCDDGSHRDVPVDVVSPEEESDESLEGEEESPSL